MAHRKMYIQPHKTNFPVRVGLLHDPVLNKGTAFSKKERDAFGLLGLLPPHIATQEEQEMRIMENFHKKPTDIERFIYLMSLRERNQTLFYRVIIDHIEEMMPIIYTPTVGQVCQEYGHIFQRPEGIFISAKDRYRVNDILSNWPYRDVRVIVVTDGERILGLGDLGANGMGIPVGKLCLYSACAGINPTQCLPVTIDTGTNNEQLLNDPLYIGIRRKRLRGKLYDDLIDEFIIAVQEMFPWALVQFEDFANTNAFRLLQVYKDRICTFDDDIQGTAGVALAGLFSSLRITGGKLSDQKILFLGAGEAGIGIGELIVYAMEEEGMSETEAKQRCIFMDSKGLVVKSRSDLSQHKLAFAHDIEFVTDLISAIKKYRPTAIVGVSGTPKTFTMPVLKEMAKINKRPIVFALSNPTSKSECTAQEAYQWTEGRCIFASGSPFSPVNLGGKKYVPRQGNNAYIFPGVGLGVISCGAKFITNEMFYVAAKALSAQVSEADLLQGSIYPPLSKVRDVSAIISLTVAQTAYERGIAEKRRPKNMLSYIKSQMYDRKYQSYV